MKHQILFSKTFFLISFYCFSISVISCSDEQIIIPQEENLLILNAVSKSNITITSNTVSLSPGDDVQSYIDALYNVYGINGNPYTVILEAGNYILSESLIVKSYLTLKGEDSANSWDVVFKLTDANFNKSMITSSGELQSVTLKNFKIRGNIVDTEQHLDSTYHTESGKADSEGKRIHLFGIFIYGDGENYNNAEVKNLSIEGIEIRNCSMGIQIKGSRDLFCKNLKLHHNGMIEKYYHNMYLRRAFGCHIRESEMYLSPTGNGINISQSNDVTIKYLDNHDNFWRGIRIEGENGWIVNDIDVYQNTCANNGNAGFRFYNISGGNISTNTASGNNPNEVDGNVSGVTWQFNTGFQ